MERKFTLQIQKMYRPKQNIVSDLNGRDYQRDKTFHQTKKAPGIVQNIDFSNKINIQSIPDISETLNQCWLNVGNIGLMSHVPHTTRGLLHGSILFMFWIIVPFCIGFLWHIQTFTIYQRVQPQQVANKNVFQQNLKLLASSCHKALQISVCFHHRKYCHIIYSLHHSLSKHSLV